MFQANCTQLDKNVNAKIPVHLEKNIAVCRIKFKSFSCETFFLEGIFCGNMLKVCSIFSVYSVSNEDHGTCSYNHA